ncbi:triose-phosphate isomerase [Haliovirga abyssi]|uniref:Triosephosphate isomerase n=1 Tax=Haliovirga abyssi TaxID=2996794 RepID=A0AAU9DFH8_9FUSO|nr:triose-phosphate isomerase [Haliovirga abyssi]BDU50137.1 triosephosphate isomerase [Haliovirga abyssi]
MRKLIVAGNWKMNKTNTEAVKTVSELKELVKDVKNVEVVVGVPFTALSDVAKELKDSNVKVAAENMHWEEKGAFTGEISPLMLKDINVEYVILGHSERREYFGETNEIVNKKVKSALAHDLKPILCVGEQLEDRESGNTEKVVEDHVVGGLKDLTKEDMLNVVVAYEPVWAIGTGKTATPAQAEEVHKFIRGLIAKLYDEETANEITIQYGGSMKPANAEELISQKNIDGGLVGGASLIPEDFSKIVKSAK